MCQQKHNYESEVLSLRKVDYFNPLLQHVSISLMDIDMCKCESPQSYESKAQSVDSSKICSKFRAFNR